MVERTTAGRFIREVPRSSSWSPAHSASGTARQPGKWLLHCHIPHHTTNDNVEQDGAGGPTLSIKVT